MTTRVLIVVTHLLGAGHLSRAITLGRAFAAKGHDVHIASGGFPASHLDASGLALHQLPPLRSDGTDFSRLLAPDGYLAAEKHFAARQGMLTDLLIELAPRILITELFPFGRRNLRDEFCALLTTARAMPRPPRVFASIRDILAPPSKSAKVAFADKMVARYYEAVLVHSDPSIIALEDSWPVSPELAGRLRYTGFVAPGLPKDPASEGHGEILVSSGGGSVGDLVYTSAIKAAKRSHHPWRLLVGGQDADGRIADLRNHAPANVIVERTRPDFRALLQNAKASISLCGYNTAMDILQTGLPAVIVPFDDGGEAEQTLRAQALSKLSGIEAVPTRDLQDEALLAALERALTAPPRTNIGYRFDGATRTVEICLEDLT